MNRCISLAKKGLGNTYPNPMVGAVVVMNNKIVGEGWHRKAGTPHAEVHALRTISKEQAKEATLYVNLEPCAHYGKTPPCCDLVIQKGLKKVVVGSVDPNPKVAGKGIKAMQQAGIDVILGVQREACLELNKRFYWFHNNKRPYVILKWAESADGFIAPEQQKKGTIYWISNKYSRQLAHQWRAEEHAILVGRKTVQQDNPRLTTRHWPGKNPTRIVIDPENKIAETARIKDDAATTVIYNTEVDKKINNVHWKKVDINAFLEGLLNDAYKMGIQSILVEGGAKTLEEFLAHQFWNECRIVRGQKAIKKGVKAPDKPAGKEVEKTIVGDTLQTIRAKTPSVNTLDN